MTPLNRFLAKVEKTTNCWLWTGSIHSGGYGAFVYLNKTNSAHRISYILFKGLIPANKCVLHTCDNKKCVNPNHLFLGTKKDNYDDMVTLKEGKRILI